MNQLAPNEIVRMAVHYHTNQRKIFFESDEKKKFICKGRRFGLTKGFANRACQYLYSGVGPGLWVDTVNGNIDRYIERYFAPVLNQIPSKYWIWRQQWMVILTTSQRQYLGDLSSRLQLKKVSPV